MAQLGKFILPRQVVFLTIPKIPSIAPCRLTVVCVMFSRDTDGVPKTHSDCPQSPKRTFPSLKQIR